MELKEIKKYLYEFTVPTEEGGNVYCFLIAYNWEHGVSIFRKKLNDEDILFKTFITKDSIVMKIQVNNKESVGVHEFITKT